MENETAVERNIKLFVYTKIREQVFVDTVRWEKISIKHRSKHGSTALAMFWLRVLRHKNNYPMPKYSYKDVYDRNGHYQVILKVDSVTVTTCMKSGRLLVEGPWALEWFVNTFQKIMDAYDAPVRDPLDSSVYRQYTESWKNVENERSVKKAELDALERQKEEKALQIVDVSENIPVAEEDDVQETDENEKDTPVSVEEISTVKEQLEKAERKVKQQQAEEEELVSLDLWSGSVLRTQLEKLRTCSVRSGPTYIYKLWKSVLHRWFNDPNRKVYIATPQLDPHRLADICNLIIEHRLTANLDALFVMQWCDKGHSVFKVKQKVLEKYETTTDQLFIEYKIFSRIVCPVKPFHARFIASVKGNEAEVLTTSADFHGDHFEESSMDTVHFQNMLDVEFISRFIGPVNASVHVP